MTELASWCVDNVTYKFFEIDRELIDEGSDAPSAYDLVGIETATNVRQIDERFDGAYDRPHLRPGDDERVDAAIAAAPECVQIALTNLACIGRLI